MPPDITPQQAANLERLAAFLENYEEDHSNVYMAVFFMTPKGQEPEPDEVTAESYVCGTSACALGHGILAGIPAEEGESWFGYAERQFGLEAGAPAWEFLFGGEHVNSAKAAAARINYFLKWGWPSSL